MRWWRTARATVDRAKQHCDAADRKPVRIPRAGRDVPVKVSFRLQDGREIWRREFDGRVMQSTQEEGRGASSGGVRAVRAVLLWVRAVLDNGRLNIVVRRWTVFGIPIPLAWAPGGDAHERVEDGRFNFHVEIGLPLIGMIVRYRGWLIPCAADRSGNFAPSKP